MEQVNGSQNKVREIEIISGIKLVETEYRVKVPVFEPEIVKVPKFVEEPIKIPVGYDTVINALALELSDKVMNKMVSMITEKLDRVIDERIKEIKSPRIVEEVVIKYKDVELERPVFKDIDISRPTYIDKEIINPILKDVEVTNCIPIDKPVVNAIINDVRVTNAIIKDVEVDRAVIREKVVDVIHKNCFDEKGNSL